MVYLSISSAGGKNETRPIDSDDLTLGRGPECAVSFPRDVLVSSKHARLLRRGSTWLLHDLASKNGTFIEHDGGRSRISSPMPILPRQTFVVGGARCFFDTEITCSSADGTTAPSLDAPDGLEKVVLSVRLENDRLVYETPSPGAFGVCHTTPFLPQDLREVNARLRALALSSMSMPEPVQDPAGLASVAEFLSAQLLPLRIRAKLDAPRAREIFLVHDAPLVQIPWELVVAGGQPLCLRSNLGRQIRMENMSSALIAGESGNTLRVLLIWNPTDDPRLAEADPEALLELLNMAGARVEVEFVSGRRVTRLETMTRLAKADVVYFMGHAEYDEVNPSRSGWPLHDGRVTCADFRRLVRPPAFVFANGCETGREGPWSDRRPPESGGSGIGSGFILAGVEHYLGTVWPLPLKSAGVFAEAFFVGLVQGLPLGECVRRARVHLTLTEPACMAWMSYILYGDPGRRLLHREPAQPVLP